MEVTKQKDPLLLAVTLGSQLWNNNMPKVIQDDLGVDIPRRRRGDSKLKSSLGLESWGRGDGEA